MSQPAPHPDGDAAAAPAETDSPRAVAERIAEAARAVPGVVRLAGGSFGEIATVFRGRRVDGVAVKDEEIEVHLVARMGEDLIALGDQIRAAAPGLDRPLHVYVDRVVTEAEEHAEQQAEADEQPEDQPEDDEAEAAAPAEPER